TACNALSDASNSPLPTFFEQFCHKKKRLVRPIGQRPAVRVFESDSVKLNAPNSDPDSQWFCVFSHFFVDVHMIQFPEIV
ncbi:hypothetical protein Trydic_g18625, partial [Trypoxylus dichotomus]